MPVQGKIINLLPLSEFENSFWGRFLKWAITAGRKVIIVTELVVILAFLSRFKLDEDIRRLGDEINGKRNILESSKADEDRYRELKAKITAAKEIEKKQSGASETLEKIAGYIPLEVRLQSLMISKSVVNMNGLSIDEKALKEMILRMDRDQNWRSIELANINAQEGEGVKFVLNIYK